MKTIWWLRHDLRLDDNPALTWAAQQGDVLPVYIYTPYPKPRHTLGAASMWWLHHSLNALQKRIPLILRQGDAREVLCSLAAETGASAVVWNRGYDADNIQHDSDIKHTLRDVGLTVESFNGLLLCEPWEVKTQNGGDFKVFTPFWKACLNQKLQHVEPVPPPDVSWIYHSASDRLDDWKLLPQAPTPDWAAGWTNIWTPGEEGAMQRARDFIQHDLAGYAHLRDRPDLRHFSKLSAALHFGELSPRRLWQLVQACQAPLIDKDKFLAELGWREFSYHLLFHFPELSTRNFKPAFDAYPWQHAPELLAAWQRGQTGYPFVDAGMRELWQTGFMHNRVRMVVASFLIKHLRIDWRDGEAWFWDTLVDADLAANSASWQWVAGSGADAAPYFRIFNPIEQGRKFDPHGTYIKKWCPELARLPLDYLHAPWEAPEFVLNASCIKLGVDYPRPIVNHAQARTAALAGYDRVKTHNLV